MRASDQTMIFSASYKRNYKIFTLYLAQDQYKINVMIMCVGVYMYTECEMGKFVSNSRGSRILPFQFYDVAMSLYNIIY